MVGYKSIHSFYDIIYQKVQISIKFYFIFIRIINFYCTLYVEILSTLTNSPEMASPQYGSKNIHKFILCEKKIIKILQVPIKFFFDFKKIINFFFNIYQETLSTETSLTKWLHHICGWTNIHKFKLV